MEEKNSNYRNDWAKNIKGEYVHILNAESGLKGYYCLGCEKEMVAVRPTIKQSYFRHHVIDVNKDYSECVISNRIYRERLAEQILHRLKELTVPAVYKFPPKGVVGNPQIISQKTIIKAEYVKSQLTFYETEDGEVRWGKNPEVDNRYLLIKPDVTFFDIDNNPILFIEFVVNHKIDDEKRTKIKRLGIDTVQIIIPKVPEDEIEKALRSVNKIKWVYNEIESNTEYISIPEGDSEGILPIDEEQRKLFEESYICRATQIGNLIRSINRVMESQSYRSIERHFEYEISRIEKASTGIRERLEELERAYEGEVFSEFEIEFVQLDERKATMGKYYKGLEQRYNNKKEELETRRRRVRDDERILSGLIREQLNGRPDEGAIVKEFDSLQREIERDTERIGYEIEGLRNSETREGRFFEESKANLEQQLTDEEGLLYLEFEAEKRRIEEDKREIESEIKGREEIFRQQERRIESEFDERREELFKRLREEDVSGNSELSRRVETILEVRRILSDYNLRQNSYENYKRYIDVIRKGTWKTW